VNRDEQKAQTRGRIVQAAMRGFRRGGFGGLGVDGLAREAGVTSGAFYVHFDSKAAAFEAAVAQAMSELRDGLLACQAAQGKAWWPAFVRFYLGDRRTCELGDSCGLQSLSPEVARAGEPARRAFERGLDEVVQAMLRGVGSCSATAGTAEPSPRPRRPSARRSSSRVRPRPTRRRPRGRR
jgi:AcrR family transcriptional regulator